MKNLKKKGFTIVELVIVIAVIAVLAAVLIPTFSGVIQKANDSATIQEARNMYSEYVSLYDYTTGTPETNFVIKVDDDRFVAVVNGQLVTETIYASKDAVVAANIGITDTSFVYEGTVDKDDNDEEVTPPVDGEENETPTTYSVTFSGHDAEKNYNTVVNAGEPYTVDVIADGNYNITVKMDGVEVATGRNDTENIVIDSVTGNIEVIVVAAKNFANASENGWMNQTRIKSNSYTEVAIDEKWVVTNYFDVKENDVVYVKNLDVPAHNKNTLAQNYFSQLYKSSDKSQIICTILIGNEEYAKDYAMNYNEIGDYQCFTILYNSLEDYCMRINGYLKGDISSVVINIKRGNLWVVE